MLLTNAEKSAYATGAFPPGPLMKSLIAVVLLVLASALPVGGCATPSASATVSDDIRELIDSARGAPPALCACAARGVQNNWGWTDVPASPLGRPITARPRDRHELSDEDVRFLLTSLDTPDPCVRELSVRLLATDDRDEIVSGFVDRLGSADSSLRLTVALGLGLVGAERAIDPLIRATRDAAVGVKANAVWALGRIGDTRGIGPAQSTLFDGSPLVREAAAGTLGHLEAKHAALSLARLLQTDRVASVRRTAAWALAQIEAEESVDALANAMQKDADAGVREMCAWALGNLEQGRSKTDALLAVAKRDDDADVRETAVWSIGQHEGASMGKGLGEVLASDRSKDVRSTAAWSMGQIGLSSAPQPLIQAVSDRDPEIRLAAAWALGELEDKAALPALRAALAHETDDRARKAELRALVHAGEEPEELSDLLKSQDPEVRKTAIRGIAGQQGMDPWPWPQPRPRPFP